MYGVAYLIHFPDEEDPNMLSLELFETFDEALERTKQIAEDFIADYGEDIIEYATESNPVTVMFNGEVTAYAYIQKVSEKPE